MSWLVAWGMVRSDRLRAALVLILAGIPALLIGASAVLVPSIRDSEVALQNVASGISGTTLCSPPGNANPAQLLAYAATVVPPGTRLAVLGDVGPAIAHSRGRSTVTQLIEGDFTNPVIAPRMEQQSGRLPTRAGESALTPTAISRLHAHVGDDVTVLGHTTRVVGTLRDRVRWNTPTVVVGPGTLTDHNSFVVALGLPPGVTPHVLTEHGQLVCFTGPGYERKVGFFNFPENSGAFGLQGSSHPSDGRFATASSLIFGFLLALILCALTVATALKVTARRSLDDLRLLHENGASARTLRSVLLRQGAALGAIAGAIGLCVGIGVGRLLFPVAQGGLDFELTRTSVEPLLLAAAVVLALTSAAVGTAIAARSTVRTCVDPEDHAPTARPWLAPIGTLLLLAGLGLICRGITNPQRDEVSTSQLLAGTLAMVLGTAASSPTVTKFWARLMDRASFLHTAAAREVSRRGGRGVYAVATTACAVAACIATSIHAAATDLHDRGQIEPSLPANAVELSRFSSSAVVAPADVTAVTRGLAVRHSATIISAGQYFLQTAPRGVNYTRIACLQPGLLEALDATGDTSAATAALAHGETLLNGRSQHARALMRLPSQVADPTNLPVPVTVFTGLSWPQTASLPVAIVPTCDRSVERNPEVLLVFDHTVTDRELNLLDARAQTHDLVLDIGHRRAPTDSGDRVLTIFLAVGAAIFASLVTAVAGGLAAIDGREDETLLHQAGARRRTRRQLRAARAFAVSGQGVVLGLVIGVVVGLATCLQQNYVPAIFWNAPILLALAPFALAALAALTPLRRKPLT